MKIEKIKKPFNFILFGASGDLAKLHIFPSLYMLALQKRFPKEFSIFGYARSAMNNELFRAHVKKSIREHTDKQFYDEKVAEDLLSHIHYHQGDYDNPADYQTFLEAVRSLYKGKKVSQLAFFSVPPVAFRPIIQNLAMIKDKLGSQLELMLEKPFGEDRASAGALFKFVTNYFDKKNLYLIDHYLGKPAVRSIFPLRYYNTVLNLLLKGSAISNIQITAMETTGVDERIGFFENVGIIKDMIQSHLLQVLALLTMNTPVHPDTHSIRREKGDILSALRLGKHKSIVLGQYKRYRDQKGVDPNSQTPTFAALRFFIDLTEWYKVPIYIRTGKNLSHKHTYITVEFKKPAYVKEKEVGANRLIFELHPKEKIQIKLVNDLGQMTQSNVLITEESLACMGDDCLPAYANLILDAFLGRSMSFLSIDEILASWHFIDDVYKRIEKEKIKPALYQSGSDGPSQQHELTKNDKNTWYDSNLSL